MKYVLVLLSLCLTLSVKADINNIPKRDLKHMKYLFEDLIDDHDFSYTIFGSKPMSLADYCLDIPPDLSLYRCIRSKFFIFQRKANLSAWYKCRDEFDLKDFIFLDEEEDLFECLVLVIINKKNMLRVLHEHALIFKKELGDSFNPESFLEVLERRETSLAKAINDSNKLLGIMLGYGVRNATLFQERFDLMKAHAKRTKENLPEDENLTKKLEIVETQVECFSELDADATIHPLYFLADVSHPETIALQQKYEKERQQIIELRKQHNFMDLVLQRLVTSE